MDLSALGPAALMLIEGLVKIYKFRKEAKAHNNRLYGVKTIQKKNTDSEAMKDAFRVFDKDHNGFISVVELRHLMTNLGEKLTDEDVEEMIRKVDVDGDGQLNYEEFVQFMMSRTMAKGKKMKDTDSEVKLKEAFRVFDKDQNGFISAAELHHFMTSLGKKLTDEDVEEMIRKVDVDGDGQLNYKEFVEILVAMAKAK